MFDVNVEYSQSRIWNTTMEGSLCSGLHWIADCFTHSSHLSSLWFCGFLVKWWFCLEKLLNSSLRVQGFVQS